MLGMATANFNLQHSYNNSICGIYKKQITKSEYTDYLVL